MQTFKVFSVKIEDSAVSSTVIQQLLNDYFTKSFPSFDKDIVVQEVRNVPVVQEVCLTQRAVDAKPDGSNWLDNIIWALRH